MGTFWVKAFSGLGSNGWAEALLGTERDCTDNVRISWYIALLFARTSSGKIVDLMYCTLDTRKMNVILQQRPRQEFSFGSFQITETNCVPQLKSLRPPSTLVPDLFASSIKTIRKQGEDSEEHIATVTRERR